jgi:hypothetical protein
MVAATVSFINFKFIIRCHPTFRSYWQFPYIQHKCMKTANFKKLVLIIQKDVLAE